MYDVVIVGAGLAGLTAASALASRKVLLLERDERIGGRVLTRDFDGLPYDVGALFASPVDLGADLHSDDTCDASGKIALHIDGRWHYGDTPKDCMRSALAGTSLDYVSMGSFADGRRHAQQLPPRALAVLNAFHQVMHPSEAQDCIPPRQRDGLLSLRQGFLRAGNAARIDTLAKSLAVAPLTGAEVLRVDDHGNWVRVVYRAQGEERTVRSRAAIVATPPSVALRLLPGAPEPVSRFLGGVRFVPGLVAVVVVSAHDVAPVNYCVATDLPFNSMVRCHRAPDGRVSLHVYYLGARRDAFLAVPAEARAARVVADLVSAKLITASTPIAHVDIQDWAGVGPEISIDAYGRGAPATASPRVFLAGDYTWFEGESPFPYGMKAAVESGKRAAAGVSAMLHAQLQAPAAPAASERVVAQTRHPALVEPLLHASEFVLTKESPEFVRHVAEGNVAFYGLLLQATGEAWMREHLERASVDGLWEYHRGFGVTAADSAIVLEGLLSRGGNPALIRVAAERLVDAFYDAQSGAFRTVTTGRAAYWHGVSVETTAHVAYLLHCIDADRWQDVVNRCTQYVRRAQQKSGHWSGRWYASHLIPTYQAVRLLRHAAIEKSAQRLIKARNWLVDSQQKNGCWSNLVIDTAVAILILREIGGDERSLEMGLDWLQARAKGVDIAGEPVLYYWYDDEGDRKRFFVARDATGRIARAWAALASRSGQVAGRG